MFYSDGEGDGAHTHTHSVLSLALNVAVRLANDPEATQRGGRKKVVVVVYE